MATGKSTIGSLLAIAWGWELIDLDQQIVLLAGMSVADIFRQEGEPGFRLREAQALRQAGHRTRVVVATGGGAACREDNLSFMLGAGTVVGLSAPPAEVLRRAQGDDRSARPLLAGDQDPLAAAATLLSAREPFYARSHHRVDTVGKTPDEVAREVADLLTRERR
jgi:shikimate kinase